LLVLFLTQCGDVGWCLRSMILSTFRSGWQRGMQSSFGKRWLEATRGDRYQSHKTIGLTNSSEKCHTREDGVKSPPFSVYFMYTWGAYTPFTFRGLVDFLILAEEQVDSLGDTPLERSDAAIQLVNMALIAPAATQHLPIIIAERNQIEYRQMRLLFVKNPQAK